MLNHTNGSVLNPRGIQQRSNAFKRHEYIWGAGKEGREQGAAAAAEFCARFDEESHWKSKQGFQLFVTTAWLPHGTNLPREGAICAVHLTAPPGLAERYSGQC